MTGSEPFVVAVMFPPEPDPTVVATIAAVAPEVEAVALPYMESSELRSSKGRNGGHDPDGLERPPLDDAALAMLTRAHGVIGVDVPEDILDLAPNLRWVQACTAGTDHIDVASLAAAGVAVTHASGIAAPSIAEFVMARILQHAKHLRVIEQQQVVRDWTLQFGTEIRGRTVGIVGLGAIGRAVAKRARAFEMTVLATRGSARPGDTDPDVDELHPAAELDEVLPRCDIVVLTLPATPDTDGLIDARRLALMPQGSMLVNVARGVHVVEDDLVAALESGHLGAAALDVTREEPLPGDSALWNAPNLYLSPHSSASLDRYQQSLTELAADNLARLLGGRPLHNQVG